jgi:sulfotransferase
MRSFHVLCGLPRSGSTLLANALDQNPAIHVSPTSALAPMIAAASNVASRAPEFKSELIRDRAAAERRLGAALRAIAEGWYGAEQAPVILDKSRLWNHHLRLFQWLFPEGRMIVMVRDLRAILGSIEKQHARTAVLDDSDTAYGKTLFARANALFAADGMIGQCINGVEDMLRRKESCGKTVYIVKYEDFVAKPKKTIRDLYDDLGLEPFEHDFDDVRNTTGLDVDGLYLHKYPHEGSGKVEVREPDWRKWVSPDLGQQLLSQFPGYNRAFGYGEV